MKKFALILMAASALAAWGGDLSETKYDWSGLSSSIVAGCSTPYEKHYAIYRWLCDNIAYDTSYSIYTADECYEQKRGVCQAYSEMFCRLAEAEGLRAVVVSGKSKDKDGHIDDMGHAWVFAYTDGNKGILIDPTWGAGSVSNGKFERSKGDDSWFHVLPEWMLFTHFPNDESYQLTSSHITFDQFRRLPYHTPDLKFFGYDGAQMLRDALAGMKTDMPECYPGTLIDFGIKQARVPKQERMRVGEQYTVVLNTRQPADHIISLGSASGAGNDGLWERQGDNVVGLVSPSRQGDLKIGILNNKGTYTTIVSYKVDAPTAADIAKLESHSPHLSPIWEGVKNYTNPKHLAEHRVDIAALLRTVRAQGITELPNLYSGVKYGVQNIPWHGTLKVGQTYHFEFLPWEGVDCAVINKGADGQADWYEEWTQDPATKAWCIDVTPKRPGTLSISIQTAPGGSYSSCIGYTVK